MDPEMQALGLQLTEAAVRNTAGTVADKIRTLKARKVDRETVAELEEIISDLLADKSELIRIAQAYAEELVAQRISDEDIQYISENIVPFVGELARASGTSSGVDPTSIDTMLEMVERLLSVETVTILQLIGFNFRKAIGEPLTHLASAGILSKATGSPSAQADIQRLAIERDIAYLAVAQDPEAFERLNKIMGGTAG